MILIIWYSHIITKLEIWIQIKWLGLCAKDSRYSVVKKFSGIRYVIEFKRDTMLSSEKAYVSEYRGMVCGVCFGKWDDHEAERRKEVILDREDTVDTGSRSYRWIMTIQRCESSSVLL